MSLSTPIADRVARLRSRVDIAAVIGAAVKLVGGKKPRGKCPFHGSKSDSFAVDVEGWRAKCWGCGWAGDAIKFVQDHYSLSFADALARLEGGQTGDLAAAPRRREKQAAPRREVEVVESIALGRHLWKVGHYDPEAVRVYLTARGVPATVLTDRRLCDFRFVGLGPIVPWRQDRDPSSVPQAPAIVALVRGLPGSGLGPGPIHDLDDWAPVGVHVTWLRPDLRGKMERARRDGSKYPARKMLGPVGHGGVWLPGLDHGLPSSAGLFVGEGNETVLSGMAICGATDEDWGLAALSLGNLQGAEPRVRGAIPLFDPRPSVDRPPLRFVHRGRVTGLIDADMAPLRGAIDRKTGLHVGEKLIEKKHGPIVQRALTSGERSELCGTLFVRAWRSIGADARAVRPPMGLDFNDAAREGRI